MHDPLSATSFSSVRLVPFESMLMLLAAKIAGVAAWPPGCCGCIQLTLV